MTKFWFVMFILALILNVGQLEYTMRLERLHDNYRSAVVTYMDKVEALILACTPAPTRPASKAHKTRKHG